MRELHPVGEFIVNGIGEIFEVLYIMEEDGDYPYIVEESPTHTHRLHYTAYKATPLLKALA
jgi:hypothetical protein